MTTETNRSPSAAAAAAPAPTPAAAAEPHWAILPIVLSGVFITTLDFFIVNVAIPSMQSDLHAGASAIEWVVAGFGLAYGVGLITGGRLGDLYGRRRMFMLGLAFFTLASLACGIANSGGTLVAARVAQGVAAALLAPQVLAILRTVFTGPAVAKVFTGYGLAMGLAAVFGQLIGGVLIQANIANLGWRSCFLVNIPLGIVILALTWKIVPEAQAPARPKLDIPGVALITLALVALVLPLIEGREKHWPLWTWLSFAASAVLFVLFALQERRLGQNEGGPLVDLSLFRERAFVVGLATQLVFWMGQASFFLVFALYVQAGRGLDALQAGGIFAAIGAGYMYTSMKAGVFAAKIGRQVIAIGALLMGVGLTVVGITAAHLGTTGHVAWLIPGLVIDGAGMGLAVAPLAATVLSRVTPQHAGAASGVLTTALQIGNALGVAIIGIIFYNALGSPLVKAGFPHAFDMSLIFLIGVAVVLAGLVQLLPRTKDGK
ncbi:MFS transporter [Kitasatospora mediocidica]|uniref:MFS transporter n=1 Tax=Kitasatospora mediocidica TaxID=58352 RepID=UPI000A075D28|nr:MFS transporter [Kitasatospora mediocidica]